MLTGGISSTLSELRPGWPSWNSSQDTSQGSGGNPMLLLILPVPQTLDNQVRFCEVYCKSAWGAVWTTTVQTAASAKSTCSGPSFHNLAVAADLAQSSQSPENTFCHPWGLAESPVCATKGIQAASSVPRHGSLAVPRVLHRGLVLLGDGTSSVLPGLCKIQSVSYRNVTYG